MPIYEYKCDKCGYEFEAKQSITEEAYTKCPKCNEPELFRKIPKKIGLNWSCSDGTGAF